MRKKCKAPTEKKPKTSKLSSETLDLNWSKGYICVYFSTVESLIWLYIVYFCDLDILLPRFTCMQFFSRIHI